MKKVLIMIIVTAFCSCCAFACTKTPDPVLPNEPPVENVVPESDPAMEDIYE